MCPGGKELAYYVQIPGFNPQQHKKKKISCQKIKLAKAIDTG
jgi:hypothetical protein